MSITNHSISEVSEIAGIPKDLLRMWERRYGYPNPDRNANGERVYTNGQLDKLILIRQLMDQGNRPGKLVKLDSQELRSLLKEPETELRKDELIKLLKAGSALNLHQWLQAQLVAHGLRSFVHRVMAPATEMVGEAWAEGTIAIHEEHLFSEVLKSLIQNHIADHYTRGIEPRVMLTTVPGEQHSLGLLMVEVLLRLGGSEVISFGTEMPYMEIRDAAANYAVDIIALSFSQGFKCDDAVVMLTGLRQIIPIEVAIWVGGSAFNSVPTLPDGVLLLNDLTELERALATWRSSKFS